MSGDPKSSDSPRLPLGQPSAIKGLSDTFAFHNSPEAYIASRLLAFQADHPDSFSSRQAIHVKVLNRDVAIISSHSQIVELLSSPAFDDVDGDGAVEPAVVATAAYQQFMTPFFPVPNMFLSDGAVHAQMRESWEGSVEHFTSHVRRVARDITTDHFGRALGSKINIYESLKSLSWKILLRLFLDLDEADPVFKQTQDLQEDLLRGQFSVFPVSVSVPFWKSPRKMGIEATEKLQVLLSSRLKDMGSACPLRSGAETPPHVTNHVLMFTSSLTVKATASLLTAFLINLFLFKRDGKRLVDEVNEMASEERDSYLRSIELETERLSPPIVGIMRRLMRDIVLSSQDERGDPTMIPKGWDAWLYFLGGGRDPAEFGKGSEQFTPERYLGAMSSSETYGNGFAFSVGSKQCLGKNVVRNMCLEVAAAMLDDDLDLGGDIQAEGVRAWLGWDGKSDIDAWSRDMKQLPTQRPAEGIGLDVIRREVS